MEPIVNVTGRKNSITKSRSGHYTATVKLVGTWGPTGVEYPYEKCIAKRGKIELREARKFIEETVPP